MNTPCFVLSLLFVGFAFLTGPRPGLAAETNAPPQNILRMREVEVVATPIIEANRVEPHAGQVTTVTKQQIEDLNAQDLPSALRMTPGVVISRHNPVGSFGGAEGGAIFIRGHGSSRPGAEILMCVDGIPKFASVWTHPLMDMLSIDIAERIDVYKGPQPLLFGNMAYGAVNIIPKRMEKEGFTTSIQGAFGSYNTWIEALEHGGRSQDLDYYVSQSFRTSDGHRDHSDGEVQDYFGRIGYAISENWDVSLLFQSTLGSVRDPGPDPDLVPPAMVYRNGRFDTEDYFTVASVSHHYDVAEGFVKFYWDKGAMDWVDQYDTATHLNDVDTLTNFDNYGFKAREALHLWEGGEILLGCDWDMYSGKADFVNPRAPDNVFNRETWDILSPYFGVSHRFEVADGISVTPSAGLRVMLHDEFRDEIAPQGGVIVNIKDTEFHVSYARGVNYPGIFSRTLSDVFMPGDNKWEQLTAEVMDHVEIGISQRFGKMVKVDCTLFYDDGEDRIVTRPPPPFPPIWTNIGTFRTKGAEGSITVTPTRDLAFFAGVTYLDADPGTLPYCPEWSASGGVTYRFLERFRISFDTVYLDKQFVASWGRSTTAVNSAEVGGYVLVNGKLTYDFDVPAWKMHGQIFLAGENLADVSYEQKYGYPMPGINGMGGFKFRF